MSSENIYTNFKPTFLYIKQHTITGKLYFGKTTKNNPELYTGSGTYWLRHLKKNGSNITTLWFCLFLDQETLTSFALSFSKNNDIVKSNDWLNLQDENGIDGWVPGQPQSQNSNLKRSKTLKHRIFSEETKRKMSMAQKDKEYSAEAISNMSDAQKLRHKNNPIFNKELSFAGLLHSTETKKKMSESAKGTKWFNDGKTQIRIKPENGIPNGFVPGKIK